MGLLDELFRHKAAITTDLSASEPSAKGGNLSAEGFHAEGRPASSRGLGAVAAAIGVQSDRAMPGEFHVLLGDLLQRTPEKCIWPGRHDPARVLRVPAAEIADGLAKGRAELPLARLIALAPDVFRWEPGDSDDPRVRLPLQKLLQQIGGHFPASAPTAAPGAAPSRPFAVREAAGGIAPGLNREARPMPVETGVVSAPLPPINVSAADHVAPSPPAAAAVTTNTLLQSAPVEIASIAASPVVSPTPHPAPPPETGVVLAPAVPQEIRKPGANAPAEQMIKPVELRPQTDVPISTTLHAVILGGGAAATHGVAPPGSTILAPQHPPASSATTPVFLAPAAAKPPSSSVPAPAQPASQVASAQSSAGEADFSSLQALFMTDHPLELTGVAAKAAAMPGVNACLITGTRGTARAGQFPAGLDAGILGALAVELSSKVVESATRLNAGRVESTTVHRDDCAIAIFANTGVCLSVVLGPGGFVPGVRQRLARATELLAGVRGTS